MAHPQVAQKILQHTMCSIIFRKGRKIFELNGEACKGTKWGTRVALVCGHKVRCPIQNSDPVVIHINRGKVSLPPTGAKGTLLEDASLLHDYNPSNQPAKPILKPEAKLAHPFNVHAIRSKCALDLFSGTGSVAMALKELGYFVITLDSDPRFGTDHQVDILEWDFKAEYPQALLTWWWLALHAQNTPRLKQPPH